jgi:hypothetical protein
MMRKNKGILEEWNDGRVEIKKGAGCELRFTDFMNKGQKE